MTIVLEQVSRVVNGQTHIDTVSIKLERSTLNVLLGPTLSGKTSLMRLLDVPTNGRVVVDGKDVTGLHVRQRSVAMVYQQFINYPTLSVFENIASPLRVQGLSRTEIDAKVGDVVRLLRLEPFLTRTPLELSGGQQQRCAIARALVKGADLVLLDEPLANLDYKLREELREEMPRIFARSGAIFVYATTEPTEALLLGGETATLWEGRVTQFGPTAQVFRRPHDLVTARVFSDPPLNVIDVDKRGDTIRLPTGEPTEAVGVLAALPDGGYRLGVRAHLIGLGHRQDGGIHVVGKVDVTEITGSESYVHARVAGQGWVALVPGVHDITPGSPVDLTVDPNGIFVFHPDGRLAAAPKE
jgi:glycerol transport system ATP-binding protein